MKYEKTKPEEARGYIPRQNPNLAKIGAELSSESVNK